MHLLVFEIVLIVALTPVAFGLSETSIGNTVILEKDKGFDSFSLNCFVKLGDDFFEYAEEASIKSHHCQPHDSSCKRISRLIKTEGKTCKTACKKFLAQVSRRAHRYTRSGDYIQKIVKNEKIVESALYPTGTKYIALVYRGPAGCAGCSEAVAKLLKSDTLWDFNVIYVGPNENMSVQAGLQLPNVVLYAQPGGDGSENQAFNKLKKDAPAVRNFISKGGRYLGICMGGYLVDHNPGFNLCLNTDQYIKSPGATVKTEDDTLVQVMWRGTNRWMYFQDGPYFIPKSCIDGQIILATYRNGKVAAMVQPYGSGKIGVSGPHPEADASWYAAANLTDPDGHVADLGHDLIDTLMQ